MVLLILSAEPKFGFNHRISRPWVTFTEVLGQFLGPATLPECGPDCGPAAANALRPGTTVTHSQKTRQQIAIVGSRVFEVGQPPALLVNNCLELSHFFQTGAAASDAKTAVTATAERDARVRRRRNQIVDDHTAGIDPFRESKGVSTFAKYDGTECVGTIAIGDRAASTDSTGNQRQHRSEDVGLQKLHPGTRVRKDRWPRQSRAAVEGCDSARDHPCPVADGSGDEFCHRLSVEGSAGASRST